MLTYSELTPPQLLRPFIRCAWRLHGDAAGGHDAEPVLPDGCVEIVLNFGARFRRHDGQGAEVQPARLIAGQLTRAITIAPTGCVDLLGVRFHPWGAAAFLGVTGDELRDRMLSLDDLPMVDRPLRRLEDADATALLWAALGERLRTVKPVNPRLPPLAMLIATGRANTVADLVERSGFGTRRLQSMFGEHVGLSPKAFMRITRLQRTLALARERPAMSWGRVAAECGYYDQAHLVHDTQRIAGCAPSQLLIRDGGLTETFMDQPA